MREFISCMNGRSDRELEEAVANVRITNRHFDEAFDRVKRSLDEQARERYAREAWQILYNQDQQQILENAAMILISVKDRGVSQEISGELKAEIYGDGKKDFGKIESLTQELHKRYNPT